MYLHEVIKRQPLTPEEKEISREPQKSYDYAVQLGTRWPPGEPAILRSPYHALKYAKDVIHGRWPEAEPIIMLYATKAVQYAKDVIHGRWPEAEDIIKRSPDAAIEYAFRIIQGPWPEAEPEFAKYEWLAVRYQKLLDHTGKIKDKVRFENLVDDEN